MSLDTIILKEVRNTIKTELKDTFNRLHSIAFDAKFVSEEIRRAFPGFPIIPNLRAGAWYTNPSENSANSSTYFKSTDGHIGEHQFSLRRSNLNLLPAIKENNGVVIVDVTRRGKRFPDALSKTIPIWCAVLNLARVKLLSPNPENSKVTQAMWDQDGKLWTLPSAVGRSEHAQIESKIEEWSNTLLMSAYDLSFLTSLQKPLRPIFITPTSTLTVSPAISFVDFYPIVLVSASKLAEEAEVIERAGGFTYVQGAGDDHELWSRGLTPALFWQNFDELIAASRNKLEATITDILAASLSVDHLQLDSTLASHEIRQTNIGIEFHPARNQKPTNGTIFVSIDLDKSVPLCVLDSTPTSIVLRPKSGKAGYSTFFGPLQATLDVVFATLLTGNKVCIRLFPGSSPSDANDLGIALAMIILSELYDGNGSFAPDHDKKLKATKSDIRVRLQWILESYPSANPSRSILNRVNSYLMPF